MAKFVFRLEVLLNMRRRAEEKAQKVLAAAMQLLELEKKNLIELENILVQNVEHFEEMQKKPIPVDKFRLMSAYIERIGEEIEKQKCLIIETEKTVRVRLMELQKAVQDRQIVDKLKERRLAQYDFEQLQEEQKLLDEMGTQRFKK